MPKRTSWVRRRPRARLDGRVKAPPGLPPYLASLYSIPLLTREQEAYHFRKMNYLKYKASRLREKLDKTRPHVARNGRD